MPAGASAEHEDRARGGSGFVDCGDEGGIGFQYINVEAQNITCSNARAIARRLTHTGDDTPRGFTCVTKAVESHRSKHRCHKGTGGDRKIVKFETVS